MKIQIVSDLHLEFSQYLPVNADNVDVLVLAGDILTAKALRSAESPNYSRYINFLRHVSNEFPRVIYVAGNHEFYGHKWFDTLKVVGQAASSFGIHFLEDRSVRINDVTFVGATLWTDMRNGNPHVMHTVRYSMNDYHAITNEVNGYSKLDPKSTVLRHENSKEAIKLALETATTDKVVVVTHHAPTFESVHPKYRHETMLNYAYASDLSEFILDNPRIKLWAHGHMHNVADYHVGSTRIVCNPRGYQTEQRSENTGFNQNFIVEV